jgi:hypothetical protein
LAIGRDGVGDYARPLAAEFIRQGHPSVAVALNDPDVSGPAYETQAMKGAAVSVLRLPVSLPWNNRVLEARNWLSRFEPDWMSLQFVPFGFHPKGLCSRLGRDLAGMAGTAAWHVMFHELWLGLGEQAPLKHRILGALQRRIVLDLLKRLRPKVIHTQTDTYRVVMGREKIEASILPLISTIPRVDQDGWSDLIEPLLAQATGKHLDRNDLYLAGILGRVHPEWNAELAVNTLLPLVKRFQRRLVLVFLGNNFIPL